MDCQLELPSTLCSVLENWWKLFFDCWLSFHINLTHIEFAQLIIISDCSWLPLPSNLIISVVKIIKFILMKATLFFENDASKQKLKTTGSSLFYRATGRETKAVLGNRVVKDFYDLDYEIPSPLQKVSSKFKSSKVQKLNRVRADIKKSKLARQKMILENHSELLSDRRKSLEIRDKSGQQRAIMRHNPETIEVGALLGSSNKSQGLCPYQFQNTIQGRMERRLSHHISFLKNKSSRIINEYPIYYNRHADLDFSHSQMMQERKLMKSYHPFSSYSERRVFEPRNELDKVFETDNARKASSPKRARDAVRQFQKVLERREAKLGESMTLTYETLPAALKLKKNTICYSIKRSARETSFSPEVISEKRGCKR